MGRYGYGWRPYVPVSQRRNQAAKKMQSLRKKGVDIQPVEIQGRKIAQEFWGKAWCDHIESFHDYENRLPRGRTYVRNGSVCHLAIEKGVIEAKVSGSSLYNIRIKIDTLPTKKWNVVKKRCSGQIGSLLELLQGRLSDNIMRQVTDPRSGLFPLSKEISLGCDCPDWAIMCKHVAAALYGVGARLDQDPALLFRLRGVDLAELIDVDAQVAVQTASRRGGAKQIASDDLSDVFGIDLAADEPPAAKSKAKRKAKKKTAKVKKASSLKKVASTKKKAAKKAASTQKTAASKKKTAVKKSATTRVAARKKKSAKAVITSVVLKPKKKRRTKVKKVSVKTTATRRAAKKKAKKTVSAQKTSAVKKKVATKKVAATKKKSTKRAKKTTARKPAGKTACRKAVT